MKTESQLQDMEVTYVGSNLGYWLERARDVLAGVGITAIILALAFWDRLK